MNQCLVTIDGLFQESVFSKQAKVTLLWSCSTSRCKAWFGDSREFRKQKTGPRRAVSSRLVFHLQSIRLSNSETVALYWECYARIWVVGFLQLHPLLLLPWSCKRLIGFSRLASISSFYRWTLQDRLLSTSWISASAPRLYKRPGSASKHFFSWDSGVCSFILEADLACSRAHSWHASQPFLKTSSIALARLDTKNQFLLHLHWILPADSEHCWKPVALYWSTPTRQILENGCQMVSPTSNTLRHEGATGSTQHPVEASFHASDVSRMMTGVWWNQKKRQDLLGRKIYALWNCEL